MNYTENYQLPQWEETDRVLMRDFNNAMSKVDASCGNCRIAIGSYVGTGEYGEEHPNTIQLPFPAQIVMLDVSLRHNYNSAPKYFLLFRQASSFMASDTSNGSNMLTWTDTAVSWYYSSSHSDGPRYQFNTSGQTYHYIALG